MTGNTINQAFIKQFEREVHEAYQRTSTRLRPFVRSQNNVIGSSAVFQKVGKGTASTKTQNGLVPVMNVDHSTIEVTLQDYYGGDWVDKLDELKTNIDERAVVANAGAYALGRKTDDLIVTALASNVTAGQSIAHGGVGMTIVKALKTQEVHGNNDVPADDGRITAVGWKQWNDLLQIDEFSNSQYVGDGDLPFVMPGTPMKRWAGSIWLPFSGLPVDGSSVRSCFSWHKTAVGFASGSDVTSDITWHGDRASNFINNMMSQGAGLIDGLGAITIYCQE